MEFRFIDQNDSFLEQVIALGKKNSQTLGLMPRDAYIEQARKRCVVIAFKSDSLLGFCLFRVTPTKHRIGITQVCVDSSSRQMGVAKLLLTEIKNKYSLFFDGMLVSCREDYESACQLWLKFGFIKKKRVRSRSVNGEKYLIKFWYSFGKRDLFNLDENLDFLRVALDVNILIRLHDNLKGNDEIQQLMADWLTDEVEYCYALETFNEIHRDKDHKRTASMVKFLHNFKQLESTSDQSEEFMGILKELHPGNSENHHSDRRQLAECKACNIAYFITIDNELVSKRESIYDQIGISVILPAEFILEIDELKNKRLYEPFRLQGAKYEIKKVNSGELSDVVEFFLRNDQAEKKSDFKAKVSTVIACGGIIKMISSPGPHLNMIGAYGFFSNSDSVTLVFIRIKSTTLANTLFYQLLVVAIRDAIQLKLKFVRITESFLSPDQEEILSQNGFLRESSHWVKICIADIGEFEDLVDRHKLSEENSLFVNEINVIKTHPDTEMKKELMFELEKRLWPIKFEEIDVPTYIVPIKPLWASQLFDSISSDESLFASQAELSWSRENVYYRSVKPHVEKSNGRILWYASQQKGFIRQKSIVACSYLNNISIGEAKILFSTFQRFGIYEWKKILELAKGNPQHKIKALLFGDTELFKNPVALSEVNKILATEGFKKQTFVSPLKVNYRVFNKLYRIGR